MDCEVLMSHVVATCTLGHDGPVALLFHHVNHTGFFHVSYMQTTLAIHRNKDDPIKVLSQVHNIDATICKIHVIIICYN